MTYTTATQDFVGQLKKITAPGPEFALRLATVHSVGVGGELMVKLGNDPMPLPARHLGSYDPVVGDPVQLMVYGQDMLVMGSTKRGQVIPEERDFTANPIQESELDPNLHPRDFEASPILEFELAPVLWPRDFGDSPIGIGEVMSDLIPRNFGVNPIDINEVTAPLLPRNFVVNPIIHDELAYEAVKRENILDGAVSRIKIAEAAINAALIDTGAITETKISNNAVTTLKIASNSIITSHLQARQIEANHIKGGAITAFEIAGLTITGDKISANTITAGKIQTNTIAVDTAFLNALQVGTAQIVNGSITNAKISTLVGDRIAANKIVTENIVVTNAMIENGAITNAKINDLQANKISGGSISAATILLTGSGILRAGTATNGVELSSAGLVMRTGGAVMVNIPPGGSPSFQGTITATGGSISGTLLVNGLLRAEALSGATRWRTDFSDGTTSYAVGPSGSPVVAGALRAIRDLSPGGTPVFRLAGYDIPYSEGQDRTIPPMGSIIDIHRGYVTLYSTNAAQTSSSSLKVTPFEIVLSTFGNIEIHNGSIGSSWTSLTNAQLGASWNNFGSDFGNVRYKRFGDLLFITGFVSTTLSAASTIFTLPVGMRPQFRQTFTCFRTGGTGTLVTRIDVQTNGQVVKVEDGAMNISLAGILVHL